MPDTKSFNRSTRIRFRCPGCQVLLSVPDSHVGKAFCCPKCDSIQKVRKDGSSALIPKVEAELPTRTQPKPKPKTETPTPTPRPRIQRRPISERPKKPGISINPIWFVVAGCAMAVIVFAMILFLGGTSQEQIDLKSAARQLSEDIVKDPLAPLSYVGGDSASSIRSMLRGKKVHLLGTPITGMQLHEAGVTGKTGLTIMAVTTASNSQETRMDLNWQRVDGKWRLKTARYGEQKFSVIRLYDKVAMAADQRRRKILDERKLAEAFEIRKDNLLDLFRNAERAKLRDLASEVTHRTVVDLIVRFYGDMVDLTITEKPWEQDGNSISWSMPYVANYHRGGRRVEVTGMLNTFWRMEGPDLALVDFSFKVENEKAGKANPAKDMEHILRYSFELRFTEVPARRVFDYLESDKIRFQINSGIPLDKLITLHMNNATLKQILDVLSDQLGIKYGFTSDGRILITKK